MAAIDHTFERIDHSLRDLGDEMRAMRSDLSEDMRAMRSDFTAEFRALHRLLTQIGFGLAGILTAGLITLIANQL